jgi:hypothetical protein
MIHHGGRRMRAGGAKQKGNNLENTLAKELSLWLTHGEHNDVLERSPASGGKATTARQKNIQANHIAGDLIATTDAGYVLINRFVIEAKHQNEVNININGLVFGTSKSGVISYWIKLLGECDATQKLPMLIFRQNNRPAMMGLCKDGVDLFKLNHHTHAVFKIGKKSMFLLAYSLFLQNADPDVLS